VTVVVLEPFKLGDFIQSTALLRDLRRRWPGRGLVLAASRPEVAEAAGRSGLADEVALLDLAAWEAGDPGDLPEAGLLVNLSSAPGPARMAWRAKAEQKIGPKLPDGGRLVLEPLQALAAAMMAADRRLGQINLVDLWRLAVPGRPAVTAGARTGPAPWEAADDPAGAREAPAGTDPWEAADDPAGGPRLHWPLLGPGEDPAGDPPRPGRPGETGRAPLVGLHLGCGHHLRRWPAERFAALARALAPAGIVLLGGPSERALARRFLDLDRGRVGPPAADLVGLTTLAQLGRVLADLDLVVGADTSVTHLAAAVGTPVLGIFGGPAWAGETAPYMPGATIVQGLGPCSPCREIDRCPKGRCPALPPAAAAIRAARLALAGSGPATAKSAGQAPGETRPAPRQEAPEAARQEAPEAEPPAAWQFSPQQYPQEYPQEDPRQDPQEDPEDPALSGGWSSTTLSARHDRLGQTIRPARPGPADGPIGLGLVLRAAGAVVLNLADEAWLEAEAAVRGASGGPVGVPDGVSDGAPVGDPVGARAIIQRVAKAAFGQSGQRSRFEELAMGLVGAQAAKAASAASRKS
jgi:ADP-heptose:LPS heptosyltransferase